VRRAGVGGAPFAVERGAGLARVLIVVLAMVVAFGVGAFAASRTELFPPQVEGGVPAPTDPPGDDGPSLGTAERWSGEMTSETSQAYREGACTSNWRSTMHLLVEADGSVRGSGRTRLLGEARCPFTGGQDQIEGYVFDVRGTLGDEAFQLRLGGFERTGGNLDYGGFQITVASAEPAIEVPLDGPQRSEVRVSFATTVADHLVRSTNVLHLSCRSCDSG